MNSYMASMGTTANGYSNTSTGLFAFNVSYGIRDCTDGSSNTVAFSEKLCGTTGNSTGSNPGYRGNGVNGAGPTNFSGRLPEPHDRPDRPEQLLEYLQGPDHRLGQPRQQRRPVVDRRRDGLHDLQHDRAAQLHQYAWGNCRNGCGGCSPDGSAYSNASSNHSGGCNVLMGDGSVKFVKATINNQTWWSIGTKANGEVVGSDAY